MAVLESGKSAMEATLAAIIHLEVLIISGFNFLSYCTSSGMFFQRISWINQLCCITNVFRS